MNGKKYYSIVPTLVPWESIFSLAGAQYLAVSTAAEFYASYKHGVKQWFLNIFIIIFIKVLTVFECHFSPTCIIYVNSKRM